MAGNKAGEHAGERDKTTGWTGQGLMLETQPRISVRCDAMRCNAAAMRDRTREFRQ
jgi:hypothetical protein